jgi:hypothetical protein
MKLSQLFRRTRVGVSFYLAPLFFHDATQLAFHGFESVVDHFVERLMRAVVHLFLVCDQLVTARNGHIDATPVRVSLVMGVIGLLDGHVAAVDMIAKFFQARCIIQNEIVDLVCFFQTPISDLNWQLHSWLNSKLNFDGVARDKKNDNCCVQGQFKSAGASGNA